MFSAVMRFGGKSFSKEAAEQAHADRLSRIDDLAASFAEIEGTSRSTEIFEK